MSCVKFEERWHNVCYLDETYTVKQIYMGIAIRGEMPPASLGFKHLD